MNPSGNERTGGSVERDSAYGSKANYSRPDVFQTYDQVRFTSYGGRLFDRMEKRVLLRSVPTDTATRILECGCGTGRFSAELARRGYRLTATDVSQGMLDLTRQRLASEGLEARVDVQYGDIYKLNFPDASFDFAYTIRVLNQLARNADKQRAIREMARVVAPGGYLLFDVVNLWSLAILSKPSWHISPPAVKRMLTEAGLRLCRMSGRMVLSQTAIEVLPRPLAWLTHKIDMGLCAVLPWLGTRVYYLARKAPP